MRIAFLVFNLDGTGGTSRSAITQACALGRRGHQVHLVSITRSGEQPHYPIDDEVQVSYLVDVRDGDAPAVVAEGVATPEEAAEWHARPSLLVPPRWDGQFTALCDVAMEAFLPGLDAEVLVTVTPGLLAAAERLVPAGVALVHQEHRSSSDRVSGLEPLLAVGPRADVVALLTDSTADWLRGQLGASTPPLVVMPNPLPQAFAPRARLDQPVIVAAGRLVGEKQLGHLVRAFASVADRLPGWRLRIFGFGPTRNLLLAQGRKEGLYDRLELPGVATDMPGEWAKASIAALCSSAEGWPLVLQEAMAAGVPVVSYDCPSGPREIVEHEADGLLVPSGSIEGLAAALLRLASDSDLRQRLGDRAAATARSWDPDATAARWEQVFAEATARRRTGSGRATARHRFVGTPTREIPGHVADELAWRGTDAVTPEQARRQLLALATSTADDTTEGWFVVPPLGERPATVVVPLTDRARYLRRLAATPMPDWASLRDPGDAGWPERRGPVADLAAALADRGVSPRVCLEPWPWAAEGRASLVAHGCGVDVQFWPAGIDGDLVAPPVFETATNPYVDHVAVGSATAVRTLHGLDLPTLPVMAGTTLGEVAFPIDVVYTWVDGDDPAWQRSRDERLAGLRGEEVAESRESSGRARFESRDELRYSLRSLHLFAPWVRRIHLVTAGQVPPWLDADHPRVHVVDHRDILPADALPTFNSHAIETALHRIDGLAEHFVYFNDDMLLGRPLGPERFFDTAGRFAVFTSRHLVGVERPGLATYETAAMNNRALLEAAYGVTLTHHLAHAPYPHRVSVLADLAERFAEAVEETARSPFRAESDVSVASSLAQHLGLITGTAFPATIDTVFVDLASTNVSLSFTALLDRATEAICVGDQHDYAFEVGRVDRLLADFLGAYYPLRAPWER